MSVLLGLAWRLARYGLRFPVWGDESFVCLNLLDRDYVGMLGPLQYGQIVPLLFMWLQLATVKVLGTSECAIRLVPLVAGIGALPLFWAFARQCVGCQAAGIALAILAVSFYPVRHSCECKPYAFDLFFAVALLAPSACFVRRPWQMRWLWLLVVIGPLAVLGSFPAIFIAGGVGGVLLPIALRQRRQTIGLLAGYGVLTVASFAAHYAMVGRSQLNGQGGQTGAMLNQYWAEAFPPHHLVPLLGWLLRTHCGDLVAYPIGGGNGGSALTFILCILGGWRLARRRTWPCLMLCLAPFGLAFLAAWLHLYPYGGSTRILQHMAPAVCLLAGVGIVALFRRWRLSRGVREAMAGCVFLTLMAIACGGIVLNIVRPYKTQGDWWAREIVRDARGRSAGQRPVLILNAPYEVKPTLLWYLRRHSDRFQWAPNLESFDPGIDERFFALRFGWHPCGRFLPPAFGGTGRAGKWSLEHYADLTVCPDTAGKPVEHCEQFLWTSYGHRPDRLGPHLGTLLLSCSKSDK